MTDDDRDMMQPMKKAGLETLKMIDEGGADIVGTGFNGTFLTYGNEVYAINMEIKRVYDEEVLWRCERCRTIQTVREPDRYLDSDRNPTCGRCRRPGVTNAELQLVKAPGQKTVQTTDGEHAITESKDDVEGWDNVR